MKITCSKCGSRYSVADGKVRGRMLRVQCATCGAAIFAMPDAEPSTAGTDSGERTIVMPSPSARPTLPLGGSDGTPSPRPLVPRPSAIPSLAPRTSSAPPPSVARASESPPPRARLALRPPPQSTPEAPSEAVLGLASARPPALPRSGPPPIPGPRTPPPVPSKRPAPTKPPPLPSQRPERTPKPAASDDEASMLADVRVLAALSGSTPAQAPTLAAPLALPPTISPPSTPPPAHAPAARAPSLIMSGAILGGCALVAGALVAGAMLGRPPSDPTPAVPVAATEPVRDEPPPAPIVAAPAPVVAPAAPAPVAAQEGRASRSRSSRSRRSSTARAASDDAPVVRASSGASEASVERSTPEIAAPAPAPDVDLPEMPGRDSVVAAMERIEASVSACAQGEHGTAIVAIVVAGESGRVTSANVSGQFAGTPVGSCVARAVRNARFDRFERATFSVSYPFRL